MKLRQATHGPAKLGYAIASLDYAMASHNSTLQYHALALLYSALLCFTLPCRCDTLFVYAIAGIISCTLAVPLPEFLQAPIKRSSAYFQHSSRTLSIPGHIVITEK